MNKGISSKWKYHAGIITVMLSIASAPAYTQGLFYEYWIDNDTQNRISAQSSGNILTPDIDLSKEKPGMHILSFRVSDDGENWSAPKSAYVVKPHYSESKAGILSGYRWMLDNGRDFGTSNLDSPGLPYTGEISLNAKPAKLTPENMVVLDANEGNPRFGAMSSVNLAFCDANGIWGTERTDSVAIAVPASDADLTEFIDNYDASKGNSGWTWKGSIGLLIQDNSHWSGEKHPYFCMGNPSDRGFTTTMTQTIAGLPAGIYVLSAYGRANTEVTMQMSVGEYSVEFPAVGSIGGELWENALPGDPALNLKDGGGWSRRSLIFVTDGNPFEIKISGTTTERYQWFDISDFSLYAYSTGTLHVNFPEDTDLARYANMRLVLDGDGRKMSSVVSSTAKEYMFHAVPAASLYSLRLENSYGHTVAALKDIKLSEGTTSVVLSNFKKLTDLSVNVLDPDSNSISEYIAVEWADTTGTTLAKDKIIRNIPEKEPLLCKISLEEKFGVSYTEPTPITIIANPESPETEITLQPLSTKEISGEIYGKDLPLSNASVSATEFVNGQYPRTVSTRTNREGAFSLPLCTDSVKINIMADGFIDLSEDMAIESDSLGRIEMTTLSGAVVAINATYNESSSEGPKASMLKIGIPDMSIIARNLTTNADSIAVNSQNGRLVLPDAKPGDKVELTITSPAGIFTPVTASTEFDENGYGECNVELTEPAYIEAIYVSSQNKNDKAILFDDLGNKVAAADYVAQTATFSKVSPGDYRIVSLNAELAVANIPSIAFLSDMGWTEGVDYTCSEISAREGYVSSVTIGGIPRGNTFVRHTGEKASFSSKKTTATVGNYLTLTAFVDFKEEYEDEIDNLNLIVEIPEGVEYIDNSAMVGNHVNHAELSGRRLVIPVDDLDIGEQVKFCVTPLNAGLTVIPAYLEFSLSGETLTESLGSAGVEVENMKITVPEIVPSSELNITGMAPPNSEISIIDCGGVIAQFKAKSDGSWQVTCQLNDAFHLSLHNIYAKVNTPNGKKLVTDTYAVKVDLTENEVKSVTMINTAHNSQNLNTCEYVTVFDFKNPPEESPVYWYWPKYPNFTFITKFRDNDPANVKNVKVKVKTSDGNERIIPTIYDPASEGWVGCADFHSNSLPVNVAVLSEGAPYSGGSIDAKFIESNCAWIYLWNVIFPEDDSELPDVTLPENEDDDVLKFSADDNGKKTDANLELDETNEIPDKSLDSEDVTRLEVPLEGSDPLTVTVDLKKDEVIVYTPVKFMEIISGFMDLLPEDSEARNNAENAYDQLKGEKKFHKIRLKKFVSFADALDIIMKLTGQNDPVIAKYAKLIRRYERLRDCEFPDNAYIDARIADLRRALEIYLKVNKLATVLEWLSGKCSKLHVTGALHLGAKGIRLATNIGDDLVKQNALRDLWRFEENCGLDHNGDPVESGNRDAKFVMDPSGYVYEAVTSNRLPGVTATVYENVKEEDIYGDIHSEARIWDAKAYSQRNPVITDENGVYAWDVPTGEWQVRFSKDGYEPTSTGWLPVPPPQLEVNIGMVHAVNPDAINATAFESGVIVEFDKYMRPESFSENSIKASSRGKYAAGKIVSYNMETDPYTGISYASKMKLEVNDKLIVGDTIDISVGNSPLSYASMEMQGKRNFRVAVQPEITDITADSIVSISAGSSAVIPVYVLPESSAKGKKLRVVSETPSFVNPSDSYFPIDENGVALVNMKALLPGDGAVTYSIDGYDISATTRIEVEEVDESRVNMPFSSVISGSVVAHGTEITLSTDTPDAAIYYTLDGTCPCLDGSRMPYTGPISVTEDMVVKAQAFKGGLAPSEIAVFHYIVDLSGIDSAIYDNISVSTENEDVIITAPEGSAYDIYDTDGMSVASGKVGNTTETVRVPYTGVYFVHISLPGMFRHTVKIVI